MIDTRWQYGERWGRARHPRQDPIEPCCAGTDDHGTEEAPGLGERDEDGCDKKDD